jgi:hypothetical protein
MNTPSSSPAGVDVRPYNDGTVTRLRYRGWILDVDSAGSITAPRQTVAGVVDDLAVCLDAAHTIAATNKAAARTAAAAAKPHAPESIAATPDRRPRLRPLVQVLQAARELAKHNWHPSRNDIYACTKQAWIDHEMSVPFAWLLRALREALPPNTTLTEYNDRSNHATAIGLYDTVIRNLTAAPCRQQNIVQAAS